jgi:PIN domain nuclease of toxin-antitoxin system
MSQYVADTHALYWHLTGDSNLSATAHDIFQETDAGFHQIFIPGIVLIEMIYLVERGRLDTTDHTRWKDTPRCRSADYLVTSIWQFYASNIRSFIRTCAATPRRCC